MAISSPPRRGDQAAPHRQRGLITALVLALAVVVVQGAVVAALLACGGSPGSGLQGSGVAATQPRVLPRFRVSLPEPLGTPGRTLRWWSYRARP